MLPIILYSTTVARMDGKKSCNIVWPSGNSGSGNSTSGEDDGFIESDGSTFTLYTFTLGFAIPLSLILIFYYLVLRKLRTVGPKSKSKEKKRSHRKVTKLVLTVIAVYILFWLPYWVNIINIAKFSGAFMITKSPWSWKRIGIWMRINMRMPAERDLNGKQLKASIDESFLLFCSESEKNISSHKWIQTFH